MYVKKYTKEQKVKLRVVYDYSQFHSGNNFRSSSRSSWRKYHWSSL